MIANVCPAIAIRQEYMHTATIQEASHHVGLVAGAWGPAPRQRMVSWPLSAAKRRHPPGRSHAGAAQAPFRAKLDLDSKSGCISSCYFLFR